MSSSVMVSDQFSGREPPFLPLKCGFLSVTSRKIIAIICLISLPFFVAFRFSSLATQTVSLADAIVFRDKISQNDPSLVKGSEDDYYPQSSNNDSEDKFLSGLLASDGFNEGSCLSRYQSWLYRKKPSPYKPSSYLLSRLRSYEHLHKLCGPHTTSYNKTIKQLRSRKNSIIISSTAEEESLECKYVVWVSFSGLGNRILTLASAFLYAILTNRVLLIDPGKDMPDLFCEPFPETSWLLPLDFPLKSRFDKFNQKTLNSYGNMIKRNKANASSSAELLIPSYLYLHLVHDYDDNDRLLFCDQHYQTTITKIPWLVMKSDNYFVPSLFLSPSFDQELSRLFLNKETVFHHLGRYLFHPSNQVWGLITRYYKNYLARADEIIGLQIRVFESSSGPHQHVMDQILACTLKQNLLPEVDEQESSSGKPKPKPEPKSKAVLMTSLSSGYFENLRNMYWEHPTVTGDLIGFHQPSHEEFQQVEKLSHERKAWAEMYLLSLTDVLVTSAWSTFGYVAQGLGGLKPLILFKPENRTVPDPACVRVISMEPCFHAPPNYDCKAKKGADPGNLVPNVRHCEDMSWGLKLVDIS